mgnify:CR=1 FL=1
MCERSAPHLGVRKMGSGLAQHVLEDGPKPEAITPTCSVEMTAISVILSLFLAGRGSFCSLRFPTAQWGASPLERGRGTALVESVGNAWVIGACGRTAIPPLCHG